MNEQKQTESEIDEAIMVASRNFNLSRDQTALLSKLTRIHGPVRLSREKSGLHFNFASPEGIKRDGAIELQKRHCSLNADKYVKDPKKNDMVGMCHKYNIKYSVSELLSMLDLYQRIPNNTKVDFRPNRIDFRAYLSYDKYGNAIPESVGTVIPVTELSEDHPAIIYLKTRKGGAFDPIKLYEHFRLSYCSKHNPERKYTIMPNGFTKSPEGRIVFFMDQHGKERGWQARLIEIDHEHKKYYWNPFKEAFLPVYIKSSHLPDNQRDKNSKNIEKEWTLLSPYADFEKFTMPKYLIATGSERNTVLLGFDGANKLAKDKGFRGLFLCEGPMDAARIYQCGYPAAAVMGKYISKNQANLAANSFDFVVSVSDNDSAGSDFLDWFNKTFTNIGIPVYNLIVPDPYKDAGECPTDILSKHISDLFEET